MAAPGKDDKPKNRKGGPPKRGVSKPKKDKPAPSNQKNAGAPKKAWGKKSSTDKQGDVHTAQKTLKSVKVKLDKEGRDTILDILHRLHVIGVNDGASDSGSSHNGDLQEDTFSEDDNNDGADDGADAEDEESEDMETLDRDSSFAKMANLMCGLAVNETDICSGGGEEFEASAENDSGKASHDSSASCNEAVTSTPRSRCDNGQGEQPAKRILSTNVTRKSLLAAMVAEDRQSAKERRRKSEVPSAAIAAAAVGASSMVRTATRARVPPLDTSRSNGNEKVRLEVCTAKKRTTIPNLESKKVTSS